MNSLDDDEQGERLQDLIDRIARVALAPLGVPDGWPPSNDQHHRYISAVREALAAQAETGAFAKWGVVSRAQLRDVTVSIGFDMAMRRFVLNPEAMSTQLIRAGLAE